MLLDELREALDQGAAIGRGHRGPGAVLEGGARRPHRAVHVLHPRLGHDRDRLARGRVEALERAPVGGARALSADEQVVMGVLEEAPGGVGELLGRGGDGHGAMLLGSVTAPGRS